jgi:hypothetical protein
MLDIVNCKDVNGKHVAIEYLELISSLSEGNFRLLGMGMPEILELQKQYYIKGGKKPITKESIEEIYS